MSVNYPENLKKTMPRLAIFEILKNSDEPLTASDIYKLTEKQNLKVNFSTIYRTLNAFEKASIIVQHNLPSGGEAVFEIRNEKHLNIRAFSEQQKRSAYEKQQGICSNCHKHFDIKEMEADHITPWHAGGQTSTENCRMLCRECNRRKSGK